MNYKRLFNKLIRLFTSSLLSQSVSVDASFAASTYNCVVQRCKNGELNDRISEAKNFVTSALCCDLIKDALCVIRV